MIKRGLLVSNNVTERQRDKVTERQRDKVTGPVKTLKRYNAKTLLLMTRKPVTNTPKARARRHSEQREESSPS